MTVISKMNKRLSRSGITTHTTEHDHSSKSESLDFGPSLFQHVYDQVNGIKQQGIYVGLKLAPESILMMNDKIIDSGISDAIIPHDYHMTLFASYDNAPDFQVESNEVYEVVVTKIDYIGKALAMFVEDPSGKLVDRHNYISSTYNIPYTFDSFIPHISIKYDPLDSDKELFQNLLVGTVLKVTGEYSEPFR